MSIVPRFTYGSLDLTDYPFSVEFGSDFGNPENVVDVVASMLADGEILEANRRTNRTLTISVIIDDSDLQACADAEAALIAEADKVRNTLAVEPGDGIGVTSVFETFRAQPRWIRNDDEEQNAVRRIVLEIPAQPHPRSADLVVDDAGTPPSSGGTVFLACDTNAGWAKTSGAGTYTADTSVKTEGTASVRTLYDYQNVYNDTYRHYGSNDKVTGLSASTGAGGYLSVGVRWGLNTPAASTSKLAQLWMTTAAGEVQVTDFVAISTDANGFVHYAWPVAAGLTVTALRFAVAQYGTPGQAADALVWYDDFELLPAATTDHQIVKQLDVQGSARTTGALRISAPSESVALGKVLAITAKTSELPDGFLPDGRRWVVQGTTTADATALWGSYYTPDTTIYDGSGVDKPIFDVPVGMLTTGPYTIVALVKSNGATPTLAGVQAQLRIGSTNVGAANSAEITVPNLAAGWHFVTVGTVNLPPLPMQSADSTAKVRLLFKGAKIADVYMIPAWPIAGRPAAEYSIVDCGTGTVSAAGASSSLWIDLPSTDQPQGGWWRGATDDRVNARSAWADAKQRGRHTFNPGLLSAFIVSTDAAGPTVTLSYFPAWYANAAS